MTHERSREIEQKQESPKEPPINKIMNEYAAEMREAIRNQSKPNIIKFSLGNDLVPKITIDGESVGVVSYNHQFITEGLGEGINLITATVLSGYDSDTGPTQSVVYHKSLTDETYIQ